MAVIAKSYLLEAGVHFGHQAKRWNPKMKEYIFTTRDDIHIIDLQKTVEKIEEAYAELLKACENGGKVLFVGTKKQAKEASIEEATRCNSFYVTERWLGGTLTNFRTIRDRVKRLIEIEKMEAEGRFELLPKKEVANIQKEYERLNKLLGGIRNMERLPKAIIVVDPRVESNAIREARRLHIPVFGIVDTNCDPDAVDYVIPANDDAIRSVKLIVATLANAVVEANGGTPIEVVFTDEPVAEEQKPRRNRDGKGGFQKRNQKPGFKKEVKAEQPAAEAKEAAPATEEAEAPKKERKPRAKKEAVEAVAEEAKAE